MTPPTAGTQAPAQTVHITIDGKALQVKTGITIIEAIDQSRAGSVPRYCYHPGLSIAGNCRICQVEVEKMPRTVIACNTRVAEGMVVHTASEKAKTSQQVVLEFLLANHPLDCPVCDQSGECKLQDYYMEYGLYDPRFNEKKVKKTKKAFAIGPTIMLDQERCILCSRCVRFTDEITQTHEFGIFNRGDHAEVDVYKPLENNYSGNVADICPVGALTDRDFRFKMRVWYLAAQKSVCPGCSRGCNINIEYENSRPYDMKDARVMRLKPRENPDVNKWWMCDVGRYGYKPIDFNRILTPMMRGASGLLEVPWSVALKKIADLLTSSKAKGGKWAVLSCPIYMNEDAFVQKRLFRDHLKITDVAFRTVHDDREDDGFLLKKDRNPNSAGNHRIWGIGPDKADLSSLVQRARKGEFAGLLILSRDLSPFGPEALADIRKNTPAIVYSGPNQNLTSDMADVVLAAASYAEKDGTFTNFEGRVQRIRRAFDPLASSKPSWQMLTELANLVGLPLIYKKAEDIFKDIAASDAAFAGMTYAALGDGGIVWKNHA